MRYIARRAIAALLVVWAAVTAVFFLTRLSGDPAAMLIDPSATAEQYETLRRHFGLDQPVLVQYARFLMGITRGDLGDSFLYNEPAINIILMRLPATAGLAISALVLAVVIAVPLGIVSAVRRNSPLDYGISLITSIGQSIPSYWFGLMLILLFAVRLHVLPTSGFGEVRHLILPAVTLALAPAAKYLRLTRSEMLGILGQDYIRTARAKGVRERFVLSRHALKNASIGLVTLIGTDLGYLLGGAVITETVFAWPGIGTLMINSVLNRDYPMVMALVMVITFIVVITNLIVDLLYAALDPRIRLA
jgi:peptide/nickel transport system permease protein